MTRRRPDPARRLPRPAQVHDYVGHLLRELRFARRLLRLTLQAEERRTPPPPPAPSAR